MEIAEVRKMVSNVLFTLMQLQERFYPQYNTLKLINLSLSFVQWGVNIMACNKLYCATAAPLLVETYHHHYWYLYAM